jgi:hypothetical protein
VIKADFNRELSVVRQELFGKVTVLTNRLLNFLEQVDAERLTEESYCERVMVEIEKYLHLLVFYLSTANAYGVSVLNGIEYYAENGIGAEKWFTVSKFISDGPVLVRRVKMINNANIQLLKTTCGKLMESVARFTHMKFYDYACLLLNEYNRQVGVYKDAR